MAVLTAKSSSISLSGAGNGRRHGLEAELAGRRGVGELDGVLGAHAYGAPAVEGAELAVAIHAEHARRVDRHGGAEPTARQLDVRLRADAPVLHRHRVDVGLRWHRGLRHGQV